MKRLLLDTNIYGELVVDKDLFKLREKLGRKKQDIIYGFPLIRKELRATSKGKTYSEGKKLRVALLSLYDEFVGKHSLVVDESQLKETALKYHDMYQSLGGNKAKSELLNDFMIVACAAHKSMDLVVSNDDASMLSELSIRSYKLVNEILNLHNPKFIGYEELKKILL